MIELLSKDDMKKNKSKNKNLKTDMTDIIIEDNSKNKKNGIDKIEIREDDIKIKEDDIKINIVEIEEDNSKIKEDIIVNIVEKNPAFLAMTNSHYRNKLSGHIDEFKKMIRDGGGKATIKLTYIREILGEGYRTYDEKSDNAIAQRTKEILMEYGIKVVMHQKFGANLILTESDTTYIDAIGLQRSRYLKTAIRAGFDTSAEYWRHSLGHQKRLKYGNMEDAINDPKYLGIYIERKFIYKIFPDAEPNPVPLGPFSKTGWDWKYKDEKGNIIKIIHLASTLRVRYDPSDLNWTTGEIRRRETFQWNIKGNKEADVFILTAWKDRETLELLHVWIIDKNDTVNGRKFNERQSFAVNNHKWSLNKYSKWEVNINDGKFAELKKEINNRNNMAMKREKEEKIKEKEYKTKDISNWYVTFFKI